MTQSDEVRQSRPVLVVPIGSWEQHGPHLPFDTDTRVALELSHRLTQARTQTYLAPPLPITASGEHSGFSGTLSIGTETTTSMLIEIVRSATWCRGVFFVNGHGGNSPAIHAAKKVLDHDQRNVFFWSPSGVADTDTHAGHAETSVMLALSPFEVDMTLAEVGNTQPLSEIIDLMRSGGVRAVSSNGVLGDPTRATANDGLKLLEQWAHDLFADFDHWNS
jgi:creatinine amidohydrolase